MTSEESAHGENILITDLHILLCLDVDLLQIDGLEYIRDNEFEYVRDNFCGIVINNMKTFNEYTLKPNAIIYLCGNLDLFEVEHDLENDIFVIYEFSHNFSEGDTTYISSGCVPINIYGVGVYFRNFFEQDKNYFEAISDAHEFQDLGESNKPGVAYRKGIYLTPVEKSTDGFKFSLLRCSSNLRGPTCNFGDIDVEVVNEVNNVANRFFEQPVNLNHVLAQIYVNQRNQNGKERKSKIKEHSDKTKDMPPNALMAFCTFYKDYVGDKFVGDSEHIRKGVWLFDYAYKNATVLTKLRFRLKDDVHDENLERMFDIILYPNSVFMMSLKTNRLYTHEIIPPTPQIHRLPTRMGYVIRCSNTKAVHCGQTYVVNSDETLEKLREINDDDMRQLRLLYQKENATSAVVKYPDTYFSMNQGDYLAPVL
jgi:hypothetical protein